MKYSVRQSPKGYKVFSLVTGEYYVFAKNNYKNNGIVQITAFKCHPDGDIFKNKGSENAVDFFKIELTINSLVYLNNIESLKEYPFKFMFKSLFSTAFLIQIFCNYYNVSLKNHNNQLIGGCYNLAEMPDIKDIIDKNKKM